MPKISNATIAILATKGFEQSELEVPRDKLRSAGAKVHVVRDLGLGLADLRHAGTSDEVEELVMPFVHLAAELTALGDGHEHQLRLFARPQNLAELVVPPGQVNDGQ